MLRPLLAACALTAALAGTAFAQDTIKRTPLQKFDVPEGSYQTIVGVAEIVPEAMIGRHTHPGLETGYVLSGTITLMVEGEAPRVLNPGDSYLIPAGVPHDGESGAEGCKVVATYVVEKDKPLATPAP